MPVINHIHSLRKVRKTSGDSTLFICNHPKCTWKQPALLIEGKEFKCNFCSNTFIYGPQMKKMRFPHCKDCTSAGPTEKSTYEKEKEIMQEGILEELLGGMDV